MVDALSVTHRRGGVVECDDPVRAGHTDAEREWAYDRESPIGTLDSALDEANARGWTLIDMKRDWSTVFAGE